MSTPPMPCTVGVQPLELKVSGNTRVVTKSMKSPVCANLYHIKPPPAPTYGEKRAGTQAKCPIERPGWARYVLMLPVSGTRRNVVVCSIGRPALSSQSTELRPGPRVRVRDADHHVRAPGQADRDIAGDRRPAEVAAVDRQSIGGEGEQIAPGAGVIEAGAEGDGAAGGLKRKPSPPLWAWAGAATNSTAASAGACRAADDVCQVMMPPRASPAVRVAGAQYPPLRPKKYDVLTQSTRSTPKIQVRSPVSTVSALCVVVPAAQPYGRTRKTVARARVRFNNNA